MAAIQPSPCRFAAVPLPKSGEGGDLCDTPSNTQRPVGAALVAARPADLMGLTLSCSSFQRFPRS